MILSLHLYIVTVTFVLTACRASVHRKKHNVGKQPMKKVNRHLTGKTDPPSQVPTPEAEMTFFLFFLF